VPAPVADCHCGTLAAAARCRYGARSPRNSIHGVTAPRRCWDGVGGTMVGGLLKALRRDALNVKRCCAHLFVSIFSMASSRRTRCTHISPRALCVTSLRAAVARHVHFLLPAANRCRRAGRHLLGDRRNGRDGHDGLFSISRYLFGACAHRAATWASATLRLFSPRHPAAMALLTHLAFPAAAAAATPSASGVTQRGWRNLGSGGAPRA